jgi:hypothetical protein
MKCNMEKNKKTNILEMIKYLHRHIMHMYYYRKEGVHVRRIHRRYEYIQIITKYFIGCVIQFSSKKGRMKINIFRKCTYSWFEFIRKLHLHSFFSAFFMHRSLLPSPLSSNYPYSSLTHFTFHFLFVPHTPFYIIKFYIFGGKYTHLSVFIHILI